MTSPHSDPATLPDPAPARSLDDLTTLLRALKAWAGNPSYELITERVNSERPAKRATVSDCFRSGRRRVDNDLFIAVVRALRPDRGYVAQWRQALRVVAGETRAAAQVRTQDALPADPPEFTGRAAELSQLRRDPAGLATIEGMAGVGKTQLAVHAAHLLAADHPYDHVLFVDLRGFHIDPAQPPADPSAVLDSLLQLLGLPARRIPHDLTARAAAFRDHLAHRRALIVLDNAADDQQVRPLLPDAPGVRTLVTSRRSLATLAASTRLTLSVFTPDEARAFLSQAGNPLPGDSHTAALEPDGSQVRSPRLDGGHAADLRVDGSQVASSGPDLPHAGTRSPNEQRAARPIADDSHGARLDSDGSYPGSLDPDDATALARIAEHCGYLPLALGLVSSHVRARPGWTLFDHADRLDQKRRDRRLETGVELALRLSYQGLPPDRQRLLRLVALHPGQDLDPYAAAALAEAEPHDVAAHLRSLADDHLLLTRRPGRYGFHDLVHAYALEAGADEDSPSERRAARTRLFDYFVATAAAAMDSLHPAEKQRRPKVPEIAHAQPALSTPEQARIWLDTERSELTAVAATSGWPEQTLRLSGTLFRYLDGGHYSDALTIHGHAQAAAEALEDLAAQAQAVLGYGTTHSRLGRYDEAGEYLRRSLDLFLRAGDLLGQARALANLGNVDARLAHYASAADYYAGAMRTFRDAGDPAGEARALGNLGSVEERLGRYDAAAEHLSSAVALSQSLGDRTGQAQNLDNLGSVETARGHPHTATAHHERSLTLFQSLGNESGEAWALYGLGAAQTQLGRTTPATNYLVRALALFQKAGDRDGESWTHNGLAEATLTTTDRLSPDAPTPPGGSGDATLTSTAEVPRDAPILPGGSGDATLTSTDHASRQAHTPPAGDGLLMSDGATDGVGHRGADAVRGRVSEAVAHYRAALLLAEEVGARDQQARAHRGLARVLGPTAEGRDHEERARALMAELGLPVPDLPQ
ncbi:tetratricopeptide repeat protein [Actinoplanes sp. TRM 88003]|uniref:Tetratricopeptide repeat protein n=1 Tax=Paractinoplanes aksuensis TaxID=2939490 RepID=A0ABT1DGZ1_9ACTN|nr:tetratricopeptide repeat protein [Actinoplanes aksuensis]MCO8269051.1 tetratricopeptide repeat protein [Actinoplanes aksuensis]